MPKTHKWSDLRKQTINTPEREAAIARERALIELDGQLARWREALGVSQRALAERLEVSQANISRIEHEDDLKLSTLVGYVSALGGELEIRATFDDQTTVIRAG